MSLSRTDFTPVHVEACSGCGAALNQECMSCPNCDGPCLHCDEPEPACPFHSSGNEGRCSFCEDQ